MANPTPNNPTPQKKPAAAPAKPGPAPVAKGVAPGKTGNGPPPSAKPPAAGKPLAKPAATKASEKEGRAKAWTGADAGNRKFGQVLVDLGYIDQDQLWDLLEEARNNDVSLSKVVLDRGQVTEEQLLQALAEKHGLPVVNLEETKPTPDSIKLVPENMAQVYKILPLTFEDDTLTVVMSDPGNLAALDDLRNFLGVKLVAAVLAPQFQIDDFTKEAYAGKQQESFIDVLKMLEDSPAGKGKQRETSIDLGDLMEIADSAPVRKLINMI